MPHPSVARRYARFVLRSDRRGHSRAGDREGGLLALDTLGSCLASSREEFGRAVLDSAERLGGPPESTLIGSKVRAGAASAVLANATLAHGLDFDDTREDAIVHTGCVAVTTALAVGEAVGASGRAALEALDRRRGGDVPGRSRRARPLPRAALPPHRARRRASRAAAAAGRLYGLTEDQLVHAFGICGSQAARHHRVPGRRLVDQAPASGLGRPRGRDRGAARAAPGFTGPETVFEGAHGFYEAFAGGHDASRLEALLESLGRSWESRAAHLQALSVRLHRAALHGLRAAPARAPPDRAPRRSPSVRCRTAEGPIPRLWEPLAAKHAPPNGYAAKFSLPYLLAVDPGQGPGRPRRVHRRGGPGRDGAARGAAGRATSSDPTIDYPRQFIGARGGAPARRARRSRSARTTRAAAPIPR